MEDFLTIIGILLLAAIGALAIIGVFEVLIMVGKNIFGVEEQDD